jgi:hypothetical protein
MLADSFEQSSTKRKRAKSDAIGASSAPTRAAQNLNRSHAPIHTPTSPCGHLLFGAFFFLTAAPRFFVMAAGFVCVAGSAAVMSEIAFQLPSACFIQQVM